MNASGLAGGPDDSIVIISVVFTTIVFALAALPLMSLRGVASRLRSRLFTASFWAGAIALLTAASPLLLAVVARVLFRLTKSPLGFTPTLLEAEWYFLVPPLSTGLMAALFLHQQRDTRIPSLFD